MSSDYKAGIVVGLVILTLGVGWFLFKDDGSKSKESEKPAETGKTENEAKLAVEDDAGKAEQQGAQTTPTLQPLSDKDKEEEGVSVSKVSFDEKKDEWKLEGQDKKTIGEDDEMKPVSPPPGGGEGQGRTRDLGPEQRA